MAFGAASFTASVVIATASALATSRIYGISVIGEYAIVAAPWTMVNMLSTVSEQAGFVRLTASLQPRAPRVTAIFLVMLGFSFSLTAAVAAIVTGISVAVMRGPLHRPGLVVPAVVIVAGYLVIDNTSWNIDAVFSTFRRGRELFIARLVQYLTFLGLGVGLAAVTRTVWGLTFATVGGFAAALITRLLLVNRVMARSRERGSLRRSMPELRMMVSFGSRVTPGVIAQGLASQLDVWVLGSVSGVRSVGAYSRADGLASKLSEVAWRVNEILYPTLVRHHDAGDHAEFTSVADQTLRLTAAALFLPAAIAGGVARPVLTLFGPGFDRADTTMAVLFVAYATTVVAQILGPAILAVGRPGAQSLTSGAGVATMAALVYPMARAWGGTGIALASLTGAVVMLLGRYWFVRTRVITDHAAFHPTRVAAGAMTSWLAGFGVSRLIVLAVPGFGGALLGAVLGAPAFVGIALATRLVTRRERLAATARLRRPLRPPRRQKRRHAAR